MASYDSPTASRHQTVVAVWRGFRRACSRPLSRPRAASRIRPVVRCRSECHLELALVPEWDLMRADRSHSGGKGDPNSAYGVWAGPRLNRSGRPVEVSPYFGRRVVRVGGLARPDLRSALAAAGVRLNASAETLLNDPLFASTQAETVHAVEIVERSVGQLGLTDGATLPEILASARDHRLMLCAPFAAPYLRLAVLDQPSAPGSVMSRGRPPTGAVHVASERLRAEYEYPRGFYLRVVEGTPWLRGFHCTDEAPWSSDDRFVFQSPEPVREQSQN